jgi:hypothetical protein
MLDSVLFIADTQPRVVSTQNRPKCCALLNCNDLPKLVPSQFIIIHPCTRLSCSIDRRRVQAGEGRLWGQSACSLTQHSLLLSHAGHEISS